MPHGGESVPRLSFFCVSDVFHSIACFLCSSRQWYVSESIPVQDRKMFPCFVSSAPFGGRRLHLGSPEQRCCDHGCRQYPWRVFLPGHISISLTCYARCLLCGHLSTKTHTPLPLLEPSLSCKPLPGYLSRCFLLTCSNHLSLILSGCHPGLPGLSTIATEVILVCQKAL